MKSRYYREGYAAYRIWCVSDRIDFRSTPEPVCPYIDGSTEYAEWCRGYNDSRGKR